MFFSVNFNSSRLKSPLWHRAGLQEKGSLQAVSKRKPKSRPVSSGQLQVSVRPSCPAGSRCSSGGLCAGPERGEGFNAALGLCVQGKPALGLKWTQIEAMCKSSLQSPCDWPGVWAGDSWCPAPPRASPGSTSAQVLVPSPASWLQGCCGDAVR